MKDEGCLPQGNVRWKTIEQTLAIFTQLCSTLLRFLLRTLMVNITSHHIDSYSFSYFDSYTDSFSYSYSDFDSVSPCSRFLLLFLFSATGQQFLSDFPLSSAFLHSFLGSISPPPSLYILLVFSSIFFFFFVVPVAVAGGQPL